MLQDSRLDVGVPPYVNSALRKLITFKVTFWMVFLFSGPMGFLASAYRNGESKPCEVDFSLFLHCNKLKNMPPSEAEVRKLTTFCAVCLFNQSAFISFDSFSANSE